MTYKEIENRAIQSLEYETTMISDGKIIGTCELGKATIELLNDSNEYSIFKDSWIKTIHGSFYIYNVEPVQEKVSIKLECYDIKYKLDSLYDGSLHTFPCTLKEWRNSIFDACDVEYDNSDFPNSDLELSKEPYLDDGVSNRTVIMLIAEAGASAVVTDSNDVFYFKWFEDTVHNVRDWIELTTEKESSNPINCVVLGRGDTEDNVYYPENVENQKEFRIDNNYILDPQDTSDTDDLRYTTIKPIYNQVNGFSYMVFSMRSQSIDNKLSIELGHKIKYTDIWENEIEAYVMTKKINYLGGDLEKDDNYEITLSGEEISESSTELSYSSNIKSDVLRVERKADKNAGEISDTIEKVSNNESQIANLSMKTDEISSSITNIQDDVEESFNKINQTITNTIVSIQNTGGSNLLKNSVMFAYDSDNVPSDWEVSEDGTLLIQSSTEAMNAGGVSGHSFTLLGKTVKQRIHVAVNSNDMEEDKKTYYTFSTKIKKDETGTCYVKVYNEVEEYIIELGSGESSFYGDYELAKLSPHMNYYDVEFYGSEDSNATFTDNMFAVGDYKTQWCQASGEIMNTQVNINVDGVLVKSSVYEGDYTIMSPLEFAGYSNINGTITKVFSLNKDTTEVTKLKAEEEIKMYPIKIVPITEGDMQGWAFVPTSKESDY